MKRKRIIMETDREWEQAFFEHLNRVFETSISASASSFIIPVLARALPTTTTARSYLDTATGAPYLAVMRLHRQGAGARRLRDCCERIGF